MFLIKYQAFCAAKILKQKNLSGIQPDFVFIDFVFIGVATLRRRVNAYVVDDYGARR